MTLEKFGRTALFLTFLVFFVWGAMMVKNIAVPHVRKVSPSLADALAAV